MHGGDLVGDVLQRQGVRTLFTLCGGHISPILVACKQRGIQVVDVRHEATAVFAADATARLLGVPGAAAVTAGPGATNTLTAVKNAQLAESPLVVLGGATATILKGRGSLQDIDQRALMAPHVKAFHSARRVRELVPALEAAFREARAGVPGPVFVECPVDLLYDAELVRSWYPVKDTPRGLKQKAVSWYVKRHLDDLFAGADGARAGEPFPVEPPRPDDGAVQRAAELLRRAERPVLLVGSQAMLDPPGVAELARAVAEIGAPVYLSGMARGLLGRSHPLQLRHLRKAALRECDLAVLAGTPCDFRLDYGRQFGRDTRVVAVNRGARALRKNRQPDLGVLGAPDVFLRRLAARAGAPSSRFADWLDVLRRRDAQRESEIELQAGAAAQGPGVNPLALFRILDRLLPDDGVIVADGGDFVATASYVLQPRRPLSWLDPGVFGTLGVGGGFALGARMARPGHEVFVLYGDGSLGYSLMELDTFARHGLGVVAIVGNDASWAQIAREQVEVLKDDVGTVLAPTPYHRAAEGLGAAGFLLEKIEDAAATIEAARAEARRGRPALVNVRLGRSEFRKGSISM